MSECSFWALLNVQRAIGGTFGRLRQQLIAPQQRRRSSPDHSCPASIVHAPGSRLLTTAPWTHIAYSAAFGAVGYWYYFVEQNR